MILIGFLAICSKSINPKTKNRFNLKLVGIVKGWFETFRVIQSLWSEWFSQDPGIAMINIVEERRVCVFAAAILQLGRCVAQQGSRSCPRIINPLGMFSSSYCDVASWLARNDWQDEIVDYATVTLGYELNFWSMKQFEGLPAGCWQLLWI